MRHRVIWLITFAIAISLLIWNSPKEYINDLVSDNADPGIVEIRAGGETKPPTENVENVVDEETLPPIATKSPIYYKALIVILTYYTNFDKRNAQRSTWIKDLPEGYKYIFVIGRLPQTETDEFSKLREEMQQFEDIVQFPELEDTYHNIEEKVFRSYKWSVSQITESGAPYLPLYVAKTDDDVCVSPRTLDELLSNRQENDSTFYWGSTYYGMSPHRDKSSKWYISEEEYPLDSYPPWNCGPFYIVSLDLAQKMAAHYDSGKYKPFPLEDVGVGIFMQSIGVAPTSANHLIGCSGSPQKGMVAVHYSTPQNMEGFYSTIQ